MIKKISSYIFILAVLVLAGCDPTENIITDIPEAGFIQLASETGTVSEGATNVEIDVLYGAKSNQNGVTVKYTVTSEDPSRYVDVTGGTLEIPAGEFSGKIVIAPVNNAATDGDLKIAVTLTSDSSAPVGLVGGVNNVTQNLTLIDDDCPISINDWVGTYTVAEVFSAGGTNAGLTLAGAFGESYQIELALDPTDTDGIKLVVTNSAGFNTYLPNGTVITFDTCNAKVSYSNDPLNIAAFANLTISETAYNEGGFSISTNGSLGNFGAYEFKLTKQ
ncbi:hypothetical protein ACSIGC_14240 [Tenacibaculum sp. ZS6-P6]|uniref:hypothetical protein n=1 Tax=Tenacibaculum sp. ZS6-P6 TaxID=3447503 RepID=UPI003F94E37D